MLKFFSMRSTRRLRYITAAIAVSSVLVSSAQSYNEIRERYKLQDGKIVAIDGSRPSQEEIDSVQRVMSAFYFDQFRHFEDPSAPFFMFMSRDAGLSMGIGGSVRLKGRYEWGGVTPVNGLMPSMIPIPPDPAKTRRLSANAAGTELFFRVIGRHKKIGDYQLFIQAQFSGYNNQDFKLKKAYAMIRDFTVGLATSTFVDPMAQAPDFDAVGIPSKFSDSKVLVRYMPTFKNRYSFGVSLEYPHSPGIQAIQGQTESTEVWLPDFSALLQYQWDPRSHVRLSGIVRTLGYRNMIEGKNKNVAGWGVQLSAVGNPSPQWTLYGAASIGQGLGGITNDMTAGNYDLVYDPVGPQGVLYAPQSWGWNVGVQYSITPGWFIDASVSEQRYNPKHTVEGGDYKYGLYAFTCMCYDITPRISIAGQFTWGMRRNFDGAHKAARQIEAVAAFTF